MNFILPFFIGIAFFSCNLNNGAHAAYDKSYVGDEIEYKAVFEDTFIHLARDYNLGFVEMRAANPNIDPWIPGKGTKLILPTRHLLPEAPHEGIVINLPEMRLYAFVNKDEAPATFPLGIGREGLETPTGTTKIARKKEKPIWRPTTRMLKEDSELKAFYLPGSDNPLGTHALYLEWPQYAIHGTNRPFGIGRRVSSGCIRMYPEDIIKLFSAVPVGMKVTVVNQAIKVGWIKNKLYIEAHPNIEQTIEMEEFGVVRAPKLNDDDMARIIKIAGSNKDRIRWAAVRMAVKQRRGYPIEIARRPYNHEEEQEFLEEKDPDFKKLRVSLEQTDNGEIKIKDIYKKKNPYSTLNQ
ncbi:MAG: L,D-transpeptidase family protein [Alphaproteobacteria bacterium]|nr:L,D-transpeptidase family protein [Alphaproteobacteria bacterium]